jgi:hypothetical protein
MTPETLRAWWWHRQGLGAHAAPSSPAAVFEAYGWVRSVGSCAPYLTLYSRAGVSREAADAALAAGEIHELPSARGCTYVVPASEYALALRAGDGVFAAQQVAPAKKHLGVTDRELDRLADAVLAALDGGPRDPAELKAALGDKVRSLGEAGKKRGVTTTLPLALGLLQSRGEARRVPVSGRLDQQRFRYARWSPGPLAGVTLSDEEVTVGLARRFFRQAGPATVQQFAWWSGSSVKAARAAAATLGLVPVADGDDRLLTPADRDALASFVAPGEPRYALLSSLDNLAHPRRDTAPLFDPEDLARLDKGRGVGGSLFDLPHHVIVDRGRIVGLWEYDPSARSLVWATFARPSGELAEVVARTEAYVRDQLGDARAFSLDSPESRQERLDLLRDPGW